MSLGTETLHSQNMEYYIELILVPSNTRAAINESAHQGCVRCTSIDLRSVNFSLETIWDRKRLLVVINVSKILLYYETGEYYLNDM